MKSGAAWNPVPDVYGSSSAAPLVKHPTAAWPIPHGARPLPAVEEPEPSSASTLRRAPRAAHSSPIVPWFVIIASVAVATALILMIVRQRAELVKEQYRLVDIKMQRAKVLKARSELLLTIQGLTALERIDRIVCKNLKMVRPKHRVVLDLGGQPLSPSIDEAATTPRPPGQEAPP